MPTSLLSGWRAILRKSRSGLLSGGSVCSLETAATYAGNSLISTTRQSRRPFAAFCPGTSVASWSVPPPLLNLRIEGDLEATFTLVPDRPRAADSMLLALEAYSENARDRLTVYKPGSRENAVWMHPGEPVFDSLSASILGCFGRDGLKGAVFVDPYAPEAYLFHVALVSVEQDGQVNTGPTDLWGDRSHGETAPKLLESRLVGLRQSSNGVVEECPVEHLLLLRGGQGFPPSRVPLATLARGMAADAARFAREEVI